MPVVTLSLPAVPLDVPSPATTSHVQTSAPPTSAPSTTLVNAPSTAEEYATPSTSHANAYVNASPSASVLAVVIEQVKSSPASASTGVIATTGAPGAVFDTVTVLLVPVLPSTSPSLGVTTT